MARSRKPQLSSMIELVAMKEEAIKLLEAYNKEVATLVKKYGETRFDYEIEETEGHSYVKFDLSDNQAKVERGETVVMISIYKPYEMRKTFLKRIPESLK